MKSFQPTLGDDIIANVSKLGEDFKLQTPVTRLEIYELFLGLLQDPAVANDLEYRHGSTCGFITGLLDLCRNERDPLNLMKWFETLKTCLQNFSPSEDVTSEVFKTFSAYFPISLRASATPSGVTADDLKSAVRSCFAAHYRVASHAIPYLIGKLDQGDAVTVAVKVDILQTLDACLLQYEHPKQSVVPFIDQIWGSLKYEVRNGEIPEIIKATLKVIRSLTTRLDDNELRSFLVDAWRDLVEDLSNPTYTAQAGRLLVAIAGATFQSFATITPQVIPHVQTTLTNTQSALHKQELVGLLNSILVVRSHLVDILKNEPNTDKSSGLLKDELFGDILFFNIYLPQWEENSSAQATSEQVGILKKTMEGLAALVGQQASDGESFDQLCSAPTCQKIVGWLASPSITYPLEGRQFNESTASTGDLNQDIRDAAVAALKEAVPLYPSAFQLLLRQYLSSLKVAYQKQLAPHDLPLEINLVASALYEVGCSNVPTRPPFLLNTVSLVATQLEGLLWVVSQRAPPRYWTAFICSIHFSILQSLSNLPRQTIASSNSISQSITKEWYIQFIRIIGELDYPEIDSHGTGNPSLLTKTLKALEGLETIGVDTHLQLLAYSLSVVEQLYRRFTVVYHREDESINAPSYIGLSKDFKEVHVSVAEQDIFLHQLGLLATSVIRSLSEDEQKALELGRDVFVLFSSVDADAVNPQSDLASQNTILSPLDDFRTVPLSMGILQGLYPDVMPPVVSENLKLRLMFANVVASTTSVH